MNFNDMSIKALRAYAKENGIKLQSATKKSDIVAILTEATEDTAVVENNVVASKAEQAREREDLLEREVPDNTPKKNVNFNNSSFVITTIQVFLTLQII